MDTVFVEPAPRLAVSVAGSGELLLFLHGIRGNRRNWAGQVEFFSQRFKAAAWDARGYGDSDDYDGPLQFEYFTGDVLRVAEHFKAQKLHLIGLSMGGRIARNVALRAPERVQSLVLISTNPGFDAMSPESVKRFITERRNATPQTLRRLLGSKPNHAAYEELLDSVSRIHEVSYQKTLEASVAQDRAAPIEQIRVPTLVDRRRGRHGVPARARARDGAAHPRRRAADVRAHRAPRQPRAAGTLQQGGSRLPLAARRAMT